MLPVVMPEFRNAWTFVGNSTRKAEVPSTCGRPTGIIAMAMLTATTTTLRWLLKSTRPSVWIPTAATVPNITRAAPPSTEGGMLATIAPAFGSRPSRIMMPPAVATTHRLFTRVSRTSPTFSAKQV